MNSQRRIQPKFFILQSPAQNQCSLLPLAFFFEVYPGSLILFKLFNFSELYSYSFIHSLIQPAAIKCLCTVGTMINITIQRWLWNRTYQKELTVLLRSWARKVALTIQYSKHYKICETALHGAWRKGAWE